MSQSNYKSPNPSCIVQVTNVSPTCSVQQLGDLFSFLGTIEELHLYPKEESLTVIPCRTCCIRFSTSSEACLARHLTNTVFIDRAISVIHTKFEIIPKDSVILSEWNSSPESSSETHGRHEGKSKSHMTLAMTKQDEIKRTIYVGNLTSNISAEQVMQFFIGCGEIKYVRMAGDESQPTRFAFVEFSDSGCMQRALSMNGAIFGDRPIKVNHSKNAIVKPNKPQDREVDLVMHRLHEANRMISEVVQSSPERNKTSHSISPAPHHSHSKNIERYNSKNTGYNQSTPPRKRQSPPRNRRSRSPRVRRTPSPYQGHRNSDTRHTKHIKRSDSKSPRKSSHHHSKRSKRSPSVENRSKIEEERESKPNSEVKNSTIRIRDPKESSSKRHSKSPPHSKHRSSKNKHSKKRKHKRQTDATRPDSNNSDMSNDD